MSARRVAPLWKAARVLRRSALVTLAAVVLAGCAGTPSLLGPDQPMRVGDTDAGAWLRGLPPPGQALDVALYRFQDQTGQFKPSDTQFSYSRAVSQGGDALLTSALLTAGDGRWFRVLDRTLLEDLLKERQIIREMRTLYGLVQAAPTAAEDLAEGGADGGPGTVGPMVPATGESTAPVRSPAPAVAAAATPRLPPAGQLPPLRYAGLLLAGGVIGYDSNVVSSGVGLRLMGIGGNAEVRHDLVTVSLAATSTQTGEVLHSVVTQKGLYSARVQGGAFRYIDDTSLLEVEAGAGVNEPGLVALRRAVETAVYAMVVEGAEKGLWAFGDPAQYGGAVLDYRARTQARAIARSAPVAAATRGQTR